MVPSRIIGIGIYSIINTKDFSGIIKNRFESFNRLLSKLNFEVYILSS
jgi:hypothetical protein